MRKGLHQSHSLLSRLPKHLTRDLFARAEPLRLPAEAVLFVASDPGESCYRINEGLLKITMFSRSGRERILAFLGPGAIVGELSMIDGLPRSASVVAVCDVALSFLSRAAFQAFTEKHPEVYKTLTALLAARLRETNMAIAAGSFLPASGRLALALLELAQNFGDEVGSGRIVIRQKIDLNDLAAMVGIARETIARILGDWTRLKLVSRLSGHYCLESRAQLQREAESNLPAAFNVTRWLDNRLANAGF